MKKITIIQRILYQYRVDFYKKLKNALQEKGIALHLIVEENRSSNNMGFLDFFYCVKSMHLKIFDIELIYQPYLRFLKGTDLVILELGNRLLLNYILMIKRIFSCSMKMAFWGHAINMQSKPNSIRNRFKNLYLNRVDFWFPYTEGITETIRRSGFPDDRVVTIYNTLDTLKIKKQREGIESEELQRLKSSLGIAENSAVAIFCGRLYKEKRVDFLLDVCYKIKEKLKNFVVIIIGDGEEAYKVADASYSNNWIKYIGPVFKRDKALYFEIADIFLSPGLVGLSAVESFAFEVPMVTTDYSFHSAEIEYIINGENGIITNNNLHSFTDAAISLLSDSVKLENLRKGCRHTAEQYTLEKMVSMLATGIEKCLGEKN